MSAWDTMHVFCVFGFLVSKVLVQIFAIGAMFGVWTVKPAWVAAVAALAFLVPLACHAACETLGWIKKEKRNKLVA